MLAFGDAGYNGGVAGVQKERRACAMTEGCNPDQWFHQVADHCLKSRQPLYGGRSACEINREHVQNVVLVRWKKYREVF
jgi:membrane-bound lytic murein transglycosylase MltF